MCIIALPFANVWLWSVCRCVSDVDDVKQTVNVVSQNIQLCEVDAEAIAECCNRQAIMLSLHGIGLVMMWAIRRL